MFKGKSQDSDYKAPADSTANNVISSGSVVSGNLQERKSKRYLILAVIALLVIASAIAYTVQRNNNGKSVDKVYEYAGTLYTTPGSGTGSALTFNAVNGIKTWYEDKANPNLRIYLHYVTDSKDSSKSVYVGRLAATSDKYPSNLPASFSKDKFLKALKENLKADPSSDNFKSDTKQLNDFVSLAYKDTKATVKLGRITEFFNPSIKNDSYALDVTVHDSSGKLPDQKGTALWMSGKDSYYHFFVAADTDEWSKNQGYFQQILQSIKIDQ